jgi:hypothetical protein
LLESGGPDIQKCKEDDLYHNYSMKSPAKLVEGRNSQDVAHVSGRTTWGTHQRRLLDNGLKISAR